MTLKITLSVCIQPLFSYYQHIDENILHFVHFLEKQIEENELHMNAEIIKLEHKMIKWT